MSDSVNHHYVSECLIKNFYNAQEGKIFLFDKQRTNHFSRPGTKKIFSHPYDNTSLMNGKVSNHIEEELNTYFENDFPRHYQNILAFVEGDHGRDILGSVEYVAQMGLIGDLRNTVTKNDMEMDVFGAFDHIFSNATGELGSEWRNVKDNYREFKLLTRQSYLDYAVDLFSRMGRWNFYLLTSPPGHFFFLSDSTGYIRKGRLNEYFNPDALDTVEIGMPLNSHLFLLVNPEKYRKYDSMLRPASAKTCRTINDQLFKFSKKWVACQDKAFLKSYTDQLNGD